MLEILLVFNNLFDMVDGICLFLTHLSSNEMPIIWESLDAN